MGEKRVRSVNNQVMGFQQLIAGPLIATIRTNSLSSRRYLDYLMRMAFESYDPTAGWTGKVRILAFNYQNQGTGEGRKQSASIPTLMSVPLPLLQTQKAGFDFDIKVLNTLSETARGKSSLEKGKSVNGPRSRGGFKLRVSLVPKQGESNNTSDAQQSLSADMKVKVKTRQADVPIGLSDLLHLTASNMQVEETETGGITEGGKK